MKEVVPKFYGTINRNRLVLNAKKRFRAYLSSLEGKEIEIVVRKRRFTRTLDQNRLYWFYLRVIHDETGDDVNSIHELFKRIKLPPKIITIKGKWWLRKRNIVVPNSTTELDTKEFGEYLRAIELETGVPIPDWNMVEI